MARRVTSGSQWELRSDRYGQLDLHANAARSTRLHVAAHCCNASAPESGRNLQYVSVGWLDVAQMSPAIEQKHSQRAQAQPEGTSTRRTLMREPAATRDRCKLAMSDERVG